VYRRKADISRGTTSITHPHRTQRNLRHNTVSAVGSPKTPSTPSTSRSRPP
jgi:hypothetical protein